MNIDRLSEPFSEGLFSDITEHLIGQDFTKDTRKVTLNTKFKYISEIQNIGHYSDLNLQLFIVKHSSENDARIALSKELFSILKQYSFSNALIATYSDSSDNWRYSLLTSTPEITKSGKVVRNYSNPKRYSYLLGPNAKIITPGKFLIKNGKVTDFDDLQKRFSVEVVNNEFYKEIAKLYDQLVGTEDIKAVLKYPNPGEESHQFAVRLIGRIVFCWFLREKHSDAGIPLINKEILSSESAKGTDYYHTILAPVFFEVLNRHIEKRTNKFRDGAFGQIPYLNGGLFSPQYDDHYKFDSSLEVSVPGLVNIPDQWIRDFFDLLETYNFTVDENTSVDIDLSIDPEMLGRIFENLLARINPETGETVRKATGSFYTPREIVEYMVDESLVQYLLGQTNIKDKKLRALISYDLNDDLEYPLNEDEKHKIVTALGKVKILDPACGSGAFPIGILQKIVFILQQIDAEAKLWFENQISNTAPEVRSLIEREFEHKNFDYIRKLGVIRESIFGVDIQPIATEIARLRCFLTLVVDERINDDEPNRGVEPLPNLDFKFVTANSLIPVPGQKLQTGQIQQDIFDGNQEEKIEKLRYLRNNYFNAQNSDRAEIKAEFRLTQNDLWSAMHSTSSYGQQSLALSDWDPFNNKPTNWFDPEWMFGISHGFDIAISNPPWVSLVGKHAIEDNKKSAKFLIELYGGNTYMPNLYEYFILRSLKLLRNGGHITFIVPDRFGFNESSSKLRETILRDKTLIEVRYGWEFIGIIADTMTFVIRNSTTEISPYKLKMFSTPISKSVEYSNDELLKRRQSTLRAYSSQATKELVEKINSSSEDLNTFCKTTSGFGGKSDMITVTKESSSQTMVIKGRSISKYQLVNNYYFELNTENITGRTRDLNKLKKKEKILLRKTGATLIAAYDNTGVVPEQSLYFLYDIDKTVRPKYLLALINSRLMSWYYQNELVTNANSTPQLKNYDLDSLPILLTELQTQDTVCAIVEKLLSINIPQTTVKTSEQKLDEIIYELYMLTPEEIDIVEGLHSG